MLIKVENTAIVNGVSKSTKLLCEQQDISQRVIDYGCGKLRNALYLLDEGYVVDICDTKKQYINLKNKYPDKLNMFDLFIDTDKIGPILYKKYDVALCSFVLNVIPYNEYRIKVLNNISYTLKNNGTLYLEVRTKGDIEGAKHKIPYGDGYLMGYGKNKTFQKPFELRDISELLTLNGFDIQETKKYNNSIIVVAKKK